MQSAVSILPIIPPNEEIEQKAHTLSSSPPKPRTVTALISARNALKEIINVGKTRSEVKVPNGALTIYDDLESALVDYNDFNDLWLKRPDLRRCVDNIFAYVSTEDSYIVSEDVAAKKKIACRLSAHYLQLLLHPRFTPEKPKPPLQSMDDHIVEWLNGNASLNVATDKILVQSAYLLLFLI